MGKEITYARRYSLSSVLGTYQGAEVDLDAEKTQGDGKAKEKAQKIGAEKVAKLKAELLKKTPETDDIPLDAYASQEQINEFKKQARTLKVGTSDLKKFYVSAGINGPEAIPSAKYADIYMALGFFADELKGGAK